MRARTAGGSDAGRSGGRIPALLGVILAGLIFGSGSVQMAMAAELVSESREVRGFHALDISGSGTVEVARGNEESLVIEARKETLPRIVTEVENGVLRIYRRPGSWNVRGPIRISITYRELDALDLSGSADVRTDAVAADAFAIDLSGSSDVNMAGLNTDSLEVAVSGSGDLELDALAAPRAVVNVSGSGDVTLEGQVDTLIVDVGGSGEVDVAALLSLHAQVSVGGSGSVRLWAKESLDVDISGSGDVAYRGDPEIDSRVSGSGHLQSL